MGKNEKFGVLGGNFPDWEAVDQTRAAKRLTLISFNADWIFLWGN